MSLESIVTHFGYPGLVVGLLLEGETMLILAAIMARHGLLDLTLVILIGFIVAFGSDQFFFWMGYTRGRKFLEHRPAWMPGVERAKAMLGRNTTLLFIGIRFIYGLRTILPFVIGMSKLNPRKFVILNLIGSIIWAVLFGTVGYLFGRFVELIFGDIRRYEIWIALGAILIGLGVWLYHWYIDSRKSKHE
jgi:membrane protein DedA with SNARE-associated domain